VQTGLTSLISEAQVLFAAGVNGTWAAKRLCYAFNDLFTMTSIMTTRDESSFSAFGHTAASAKHSYGHWVVLFLLTSILLGAGPVMGQNLQTLALLVFML
jgi:hypothetical protein